MAKLLWGKVYLNEVYVGTLLEEPGERYRFQYDPDYSGLPVSYTLPVSPEAYESRHNLHPYFDNLVSEGWLERAQALALGKRECSRFELLLTFGRDLIGAVSIEDPERARLSDDLLDPTDQKMQTLVRSQGSLSGVQPKIAVVESGRRYHPAGVKELSTHIAKFKAPGHDGLIENEYLVYLATQKLLPRDEMAKMTIGHVEGIDEPCLIISRFDRLGGRRQHFEEYNQLRGNISKDKYQGSYESLGEFVSRGEACIPAEAYRLFMRLLVGFLVGNTDMHAKNFAFFHAEGGLRLTPHYDNVSAALYQYKTWALSLGGKRDRRLGELKRKHLIALGQSFGLGEKAALMAIEELQAHRSRGIEAIEAAKVGSDELKSNLIDMMEKRWNGTFV